MKDAKPDNYVAIVPIRAGSRGLANKNIMAFAGRPLYEHAVRQGLRCCTGCIVSTDIESVLTTPVSDERLLHRRPPELASDTTPMDDVLKNAIISLDLTGKNIVLLQATSPLRRDENILEAMECHRNGEFDLVLSVAEGDRSILKSGLIEDGRFIPVRKPEYCFTNRQSLPCIYRPNGAVYVFSSDWFLANGGLATDKIGAVVMDVTQSHDIDTKEDFSHAEMIFKKMSAGVELS
ncbi:acylneuraminate cytidylyltransferase family protein [uncultured Rubinisphaera sp.]|uniref:acylneuraminate cytidylyltransferase family protein n=1 Tax=uncultured Rubinisphaera sp. TaxID=1678686 RepID=UPI0030D8352D